MSEVTIEQQIDALGRLADDWHMKALDKPRGSMAHEAHIEYRDACNAAIATIESLRAVADVAAVCSMDIASNLKSANVEYMAGDIPRGAFSHVLSRSDQLSVVLHKAGYTHKHPIFGFPVRPTEE